MSRIYSLYPQDIVEASERIASYVEVVDQIFDAFKATQNITMIK